MSEQAGKLDGLREIIPPRLLEVTDFTQLWMLIGALLVMLVMIGLIWKKRQQPIAKARRLFKQVTHADVDSRQLGQRLIDVIRLVTVTHNLDAKCVPENSHGLNDSEWSGLISACYQLRFSTTDITSADRDKVISLTSRLLWPQH